jgi:hypothetical protein
MRFRHSWAYGAQGIDLDKNVLNSPYTLVKLAADPRMREAARNVFTEMEKAGVDANKMVSSH